MDDVIRDYALLALRAERAARAVDGSQVALVYRGPAEWSHQVRDEPEPDVRQLRDAAEDLLARTRDLTGRRGVWLREQVGGLYTTVRSLAGEHLTLEEQVRTGLGLEPEWIPDERFEEAYELLDEGLPRGGGSLLDRVNAWTAAHSIPASESHRVVGLVERACQETQRRTRRLIDLPDDIEVDCQFLPGPFRGLHHGGPRGTIYVDGDQPFNVADLFYTVAHEGFPGHIAEFMLRESHLPDRPEAHVRMMPAPAFVISEGLGLHAQSLVFPGDEAQRWLVDNVDEVRPDGSDHAKIHRARTILWGAWANASLLKARGADDSELRDYLATHALVDDAALTVAAAYLGPYIFAYYNGWRLLEPHVADPMFVRRLLTDQVTLAELTEAEAGVQQE
ncbi:hypothetical protein J4H86_17790 [Spiractinospora alimapuensis]|uniref:hypothetical protein n=1 Tax=Spiractinospora alimapuensis TaxID=2820884 RepID=UPI001F28819D|nr:hypothetical protein [Spiractinospora alimapuensis]QVQ50723.1 hypothetical protein J4H86_17790 [Spiractinospora alimapuensis]